MTIKSVLFLFRNISKCIVVCMRSNLLLDTNVKKKQMNCRLSFSSTQTALIRYVSDFTGDLFIGQDAKHLNRLL